MDRLPWQYSQAIGGEFIYLPRSDELVFRDGRRIARPSAIPRERLAAASYDGQVDASYSHAGSQASSPPTNPAYISQSSINNNYQAIQNQPQAIQTQPQQIARAGPGPAAGLVYNYSSNAGGSAAPRQQPSNPIYGPTNAPLRLTPASSPPSSSVTSSSAQAQLASSMNAMSLGGQSTATRSDMVVDVTAGPRMELSTGPRMGRDIPTNQISGAELPNGPNLGRLHPNYRVRSSDFYQIGKVFSILWSEPMTDQNTATQAMTSRTQAITDGPFGQRIYSKTRRFVAIRVGKGYCNALPIATYDRRGVSKPGVTKSEHTVIYTTPRPTILPQEEAARGGDGGMRPKWIRVDPDRAEEKLDKMSRLNFGGPVTIQFNVKAKAVGMVAQECKADLLNQFHNVFGLPTHHQTRPPSSAPGPSNSSSRSTVSNRDTDIIRQSIFDRMDRGMSKQDAIKSVARDLVSKRGLTEEAAIALLLNMFT